MNRTFPTERKVRLTIGYHGTAYAGWGIQPGQSTVQGTLETALAEVVGHATRATAAGRTDAGVHADGQVVSFNTSCSIPAAGIAAALRAALPDDIWVVDAVEAPPAFDARRSALRRWYRYAVWRDGTPSAAWQGRCVAHSGNLDLTAMRRAAGHLVGRQDFRGVSSPPAGRSTLRTVFAADWLDMAPLAIFEICADAFLTHMVRGVVGGLLWVGRGHWSVEQFTTALASKDRRDAGPNAPPIGLTLTRIEY